MITKLNGGRQRQEVRILVEFGTERSSSACNRKAHLADDISHSSIPLAPGIAKTAHPRTESLFEYGLPTFHLPPYFFRAKVSESCVGDRMSTNFHSETQERSQFFRRH